ncbi:MAG: hypothetical protein BWY91_02956 [bacterium ADurb.BinA028]|nr:MAG: hypothetical protein BWY91_02956 [bacterium ADurb.BinA028]
MTRPRLAGSALNLRNWASPTASNANPTIHTATPSQPITPSHPSDPVPPVPPVPSPPVTLALTWTGNPTNHAMAPCGTKTRSTAYR